MNEGVLAVGHEQHFYLFDTNSNTNILRLEMDGYFGSFQLLDGWYYVADATGLWCIDAKGSVIWHSEELGMDGVIVSDILGDKIMGSGEWDPPGGWRDFEIDRQSGEKISDTAK